VVRIIQFSVCDENTLIESVDEQGRAILTPPIEAEGINDAIYKLYDWLTERKYRVCKVVRK
jgi:hypothetical protein